MRALICDHCGTEHRFRLVHEAVTPVSKTFYRRTTIVRDGNRGLDVELHACGRGCAAELDAKHPATVQAHWMTAHAVTGPPDNHLPQLPVVGVHQRMPAAPPVDHSPHSPPMPGNG